MALIEHAPFAGNRHQENYAVPVRSSKVSASLPDDREPSEDSWDQD
jgi:hypothetical protein